MSVAQDSETPTTVLQQNGAENGIVAQVATSSIELAQTTANLNLNQLSSVATTATTYPATSLPAVGLPYAAYNPLAYANQIPYLPATGVVPPIPPNPYYAAYQYPYAYNYYPQATAAAPVLPKTQVTPTNQSDKKDKNNKKNKKAKNQLEQEIAAEDDEDDDPTIDKGNKKSKANNVLPFWGNEKSMNLNPLILTNVQNSPYFKNDLYQLKTYHEVIDEIYYQVNHLEPWERGSRKVSGQTGMCGSVRGVGAGGIVSTAFCILYKLYTLKLTRKQLLGLLKHKDSPYIRALGFMYIRFTQPPSDFWKWFEPYLEDEEEFEVKPGITMTIGEMCRHMLTKLDWYSTLFPRMPIPVQKELEKQLIEYDKKMRKSRNAHLEDGELDEEYDSRKSSREPKYSSRDLKRSRTRSKSRERVSRGRSRDRFRDRSRDRSRDRPHRRSRSKERRGRSRSREKVSRDRSKDKYRDRSRERYRDRSREKHRYK